MKMLVPILSIVEQAAQAGVREVAERTLERSNELSPTLTGESDESGFVDVDDLTAQVGYTSFVSLRQHEILDYNHPRGGEPKFLEKAAAEMEPQVEQVMAAKVRAALGG